MLLIGSRNKICLLESLHFIAPHVIPTVDLGADRVHTFHLPRPLPSIPPPVKVPSATRGGRDHHPCTGIDLVVGAVALISDPSSIDQELPPINRTGDIMGWGHWLRPSEAWLCWHLPMASS